MVLFLNIKMDVTMAFIWHFTEVIVIEANVWHFNSIFVNFNSTLDGNLVKFHCPVGCMIDI